MKIPTPQVTTTNLASANEIVDVIIAGMKSARAQGIETSVQDLALIALNDMQTGIGKAQVALVLAVCLQRLADT